LFRNSEHKNQCTHAKEYELTEEELKAILDACRAQPVIKIGNHWNGDTQESVNRAWQSLAAKRGFVWDSCQPVSGKGQRFITAVPSETPEARAEREKADAERKRLQEITDINTTINQLERRRAELESTPA